MIAKPEFLNKKAVLISFLFISLISINGFAQDRIWEFEKTQERETMEAIKHDSIMKHLKSKIEISAGYGQFFVASSKPDDSDAASIFPNRYNNWLFTASWHPYERFVLDVNLDLRIEKEILKRPNIRSIINGDDFEVEGQGAGMIPLQIGLRYYITEDRFRPYLGLTGGVCIIKFQYTEVRGNLNDGIDRSDIKGSETLKLMGIKTGFDYRLGERISAGFEIQYQHSTDFKDMYTGYSGVSGFTFAPRVSVLIF